MTDVVRITSVAKLINSKPKFYSRCMRMSPGEFRTNEKEITQRDDYKKYIYKIG